MREKMHGTKRGLHRMMAAAVAETLEPRRLLAGIESGILVARGTEAADTISTRRTGADDVIVTTNGVSQTFDMDNFTGVRFEGLGAADDFFLLDPLTSPVVRNTTVLGGAGVDELNYAERTDELTFSLFSTPNAENPTGPYDTTISSDAQLDLARDVEFFEAGSGNDTFLFGGSNPAGDVGFLHGNAGADRFINAAGSATLDYSVSGGDGNDLFEIRDAGDVNLPAGQDGDDTFRLFGGARPQIIQGQDGLDTIDLAASTLTSLDLRSEDDVEVVLNVRQGTVIGNDADNRIVAAADASAVTLEGGNGNDSLFGGPASDYLDRKSVV